jgi:predicted RNase H-like HicB family nuclease
MNHLVTLEREADGRWIAAVEAIPGALAYGATQEEAVAKVEALVLRVVADQLEHGEVLGTGLAISFERAA